MTSGLRASARSPSRLLREPVPPSLTRDLALDEKIRLLTGADNWRTAAEDRLGLRPLAMSDGPAGVRGIVMDERAPSSSLPCPSALGATWDPALVTEVGAARAPKPGARTSTSCSLPPCT